MTSSAKCHKCDRIAYNFCYYDGKIDMHDGFWHCSDHGPVYTDTTANQNIEIDTTSTASTFLPAFGHKNMNRRDRRIMIRKLKKGRK